MPSVHVDVDGRLLALTNLDKVLYPAAHFTKADVVDYYRRIAPVLLPHLGRRAPTLVRAPDGTAGEVFFEKRCPGHRPDWIETAVVGSDRNGYRACLIDDLASLIWVANLAALELHTHQATVDDPDHPTALVLDLDPGEPATIIDCCHVALALRDVLAGFDLACVVKTSGSKGLHVSVPLHGAGVTDDDTKRFALALGQLLETRDPKRVTVNMAKEARRGRVFIDWSQNDRHKTTVAPYSLRIRPLPWVSAPISWDEVTTAVEGGDASALVFDAPSVLARIDHLGDLYSPNLTLEQSLPALA